MDTVEDHLVTEEDEGSSVDRPQSPGTSVDPVETVGVATEKPDVKPAEKAPVKKEEPKEKPKEKAKEKAKEKPKAGAAEESVNGTNNSNGNFVPGTPEMVKPVVETPIKTQKDPSQLQTGVRNRTSTARLVGGA